MLFLVVGLLVGVWLWSQRRDDRIQLRYPLWVDLPVSRYRVSDPEVQQKLLQLLEVTVLALDTEREDGNLRGVRRVLGLLKLELEQEPTDMNERVLRGMKDSVTLSLIHYEGADFTKPIAELDELLRRAVPGYADLRLLGMEYGKGNPI